MRTIFLSKTEFEIVCGYIQNYVAQAHETVPDLQRQQVMDHQLAGLSDDTRDVFLQVKDGFELQGTDFRVLICADDSKLVEA